ncbi:MAG: hypothetical protein U1E42_03785 [Rhodospirillales bacterium]
MLPPVLEIYVVWHPADAEGCIIAKRIVDHFHGTAFSGLIGGAIEVYARSEGWSRSDDAPRPLPWWDNNPISGVEQPSFVAVVPILGVGMAKAVQKDGPWKAYVSAFAQARAAGPDRVGIFPYRLDARATDGTTLSEILGNFQCIATSLNSPTEEAIPDICRDLSQGVAQLLRRNSSRLKVFISHTKRSSAGSEGYIQALIAAVREVIGNTRLQEFFDARDLQPGCDWDTELRFEASTSALLSLRTDLYPSRAWCQREVLIAKCSGMPVITMDAIETGEERGSFLMDHVPRVPVRRDDGNWRKADIHKGLNVLVDECLKRALWQRQEELAIARGPGINIAWWAPHAPEPATLAEQLDAWKNAGRSPAGTVRILHPDPPLGPDELKVLNQIASLAGISGGLDIMTPRLLAARGG